MLVPQNDEWRADQSIGTVLYRAHVYCVSAEVFFDVSYGMIAWQLLPLSNLYFHGLFLSTEFPQCRLVILRYANHKKYTNYIKIYTNCKNIRRRFDQYNWKLSLFSIIIWHIWNLLCKNAKSPGSINYVYQKWEQDEFYVFSFFLFSWQFQPPFQLFYILFIGKELL